MRALLFVVAMLSGLAMSSCGSEDSGGDQPVPATGADAAPPAPDAAPTCQAPEQECTPGACTDVSSDAFNCGGCGNTCGLGFACNAGMCECGATVCGSVCTDLAVDNRNCGACGNACGVGGPVCSAGMCECPPPFVPAEVTPTMGVVLPGQLLGYPAGSFVAIGLFTDAGGDTHAVLVAFDPREPVADLELPAPAGVPGLQSAFRFSLQLPNIGASAAYTVSAGRVTVEEACSTLVRATFADVTLTEINGLRDPTPAEGGCTETVPSLRVAIGTTASCPAPLRSGD